MTYASDALPPAYGSVTSNECWLNRVVNVWLTPRVAFHKMATQIDSSASSSILSLEAICIVAKVSALAPVLLFAEEGGTFTTLILYIIFSIISGLLAWGLAGLFLGMLAFAFKGNAPWKKLYVLTAYALLPWFFLAPASLLRASDNSAGEFIGSILSIGVWLWASVLFCFAIQETFKMRATQLIVLLLLPLSLSLLWSAWVLGFIGNIIRFLTN